MSKKRKMGGKPDGGKDRGRSNEQSIISSRPSLLDPTRRDFIYDEVDDFEHEGDHLALSEAHQMMARKKIASEKVLGIDVGSSDDDDYEEDEEERASGSEEDELYMEDDIADESEDKIPDERAWGKLKQRYFSTDTTDEKILKKLHAKDAKDEEYDKLEEETARKLQERMASELEGLPVDDLMLEEEIVEKPKKDAVETFIQADLSALSSSKKLQLLRRESPEFMPLAGDLKEKCEELQTLFVPLLKHLKSGRIPEGPVQQYVITKYRLLLNYVTALSVYMMIKCSQRSVNNHPVVARLAQYRQLLQEIVHCDKHLIPELKMVLATELKRDEEDSVVPHATENRQGKRKKTLGIVAQKTKDPVKKLKLSEMLKGPPLSSGTGDVEDVLGNTSLEEEKSNVQEASSDEDEADNGAEVAEEEVLDPEGKRALGYTITKNKGLLPYRKKDQRNPRVKYRNKYQTKLKKRKGQVREVRKEMKRYEGEASGIRAFTVKSIKIK